MLVKINNLNINYIKSGKGQPFILLHGLFYDSSGYEELISILNRYYKVYAVDLPMHGKSDKPKKYLSISDFSTILKKFISKLNIKNPIICAQSGSALVGIDYASKNKIKELVLIDPIGIKYYNYKVLLVFMLIIKLILNVILNPIKSLSNLRIVAYNFFRNIFNKNYLRLFDENFKKDYTSKMRKIKCPVKLLWGKCDEVFSFKHSEKFKKKIKNCEIIEINGGHDWPIFKPKEIKKYIMVRNI